MPTSVPVISLFVYVPLVCAANNDWLLALYTLLEHVGNAIPCLATPAIVAVLLSAAL